MERQITVTSPLLPSLEELDIYLRDIWHRKSITNNGYYHQELEDALCEYLGVPYISLFTNGTLPLTAALQAMRITGEVITTPFSFVATTHSLWLSGIKPVFVDIDPVTCNLDPGKIEAAITPYTTAIMPVHVYGHPCDIKSIQEIADKYGLKVIYDAAHAFGVEINGRSVLNAGDMSALSFHATKVFNTIEGGALVVHDAHTKKRIDYLKNFGFASETEVVVPGTNAKMDEIRAAYGLLNLKSVDMAIEARRQATLKYREALRNVSGMSRDELYFKLKEHQVLGRRYFYPLISTFSTYRELKSAQKENLPVATKIAEQVICLPNHALSEEDMERVFRLIRK